MSIKCLNVFFNAVQDSVMVIIYYLHINLLLISDKHVHGFLEQFKHDRIKWRNKMKSKK